MSADPRDLFATALELEEAEREDFINEACGEDSELKLELQQMLTDAKGADDYFGALEKEEGDSWLVGPEHPGSLIGPYRLEEILGEGGFGTVWKAEQTAPLTRAVALKVIKAGMDTKQVLARFELERRALTLMDHPGIAKVLDAGMTESGRPYFAMELVEGISVNEFCHQHKFTSRQRLLLFQKICAAVNHAHQKGILHRDLKPSNILVSFIDGEPVPKIIDFGIAKAIESKPTDQSLVTNAEQFLGTPAYMSPEQASSTAADLDTRTDIYSLGIILYELLAGTPPFDSKTLLSKGHEEMRRIIREDTPSKPSTKVTGITSGKELNDRKIIPAIIQDELDWIVMKAIEKDRDRRYQTANALSEDINRFLRNEAVHAAAPSRLYQVRKFVSRHRMGIAISTAFALVLIVATFVSTSLAYRASEARKAALDSSKESDFARLEAEKTAQFIEEILASPDASLLRTNLTVAELLDNAVDDVKSQFADLPRRRALLQSVIGRSYNSLGFYRKSASVLEESRETLHASEGPNHPDTLRVTTDLAQALLQDDKPNQAIVLLKEALPALRATLGDDHRTVIMARGTLASAMMTLPERRKEGLGLAEKLYLQALDLFGPEDPLTLERMSGIASKRPLEFQRNVRDLSLRILGEHHPQYIQAELILADSLLDKRDLDSAKPLIEHALKSANLVYGPNHARTLRASLRLSVYYNLSGHHQLDLTLLNDLYPKLVSLHGKEHADVARAQLHYFLHYWSIKNPAKAVEWGELGLQGYRRLRTDTFNELSPYYFTLAALYLKLDNADRAAQLLQEAYREGIRIPGETRGMLALLAWQGRVEAFQKINRVGLETRFSKEDWVNAERVAKSSCLVPSNDPELRTRIREIAELGISVAPDDPYMQMTMGMVLYREGDLEKSTQSLQAAINAKPSYDNVKAIANFYLALCYQSQGKREKALAALKAGSQLMIPLPKNLPDPFAEGFHSDDIIMWMAYREANSLLHPESENPLHR